MKRSLFLLLLIFTAVQLSAQQATFKQVYLPKTNYSFTNNMKMHMTMLPQAANAAVPKEMVMDMTVDMLSTALTGARTKNADIPVKLSSKMNNMNFTLNGNAVPMGNMPKTDMEMFGRYTPAGKLELDSVSGKKINDSIKVTMTKLMNNMQNHIAFPDHPLKVGESFTQEIPFNMPIPGILDDNNKMSAKTTYKLLSVNNNIAVFDVTQIMNIDLNSTAKNQAMQINIKGTGAGKMNYDTKKQFLSTMIDTIDMTMDLNIAATAITARATIVMDMKVNITAD